MLTVFSLSGGGRLNVFVGSMQTSVVWKAQAAGHPQQERMQVVTTLVMTSLDELLQLLLEIVVLLLGLAEQLVLNLVEYPEW